MHFQWPELWDSFSFASLSDQPIFNKLRLAILQWVTIGLQKEQE